MHMEMFDILVSYKFIYVTYVTLNQYAYTMKILSLECEL